jgi:hypothetical protein
MAAKRRHRRVRCDRKSLAKPDSPLFPGTTESAGDRNRAERAPRHCSGQLHFAPWLGQERWFSCREGENHRLSTAIYLAFFHSACLAPACIGQGLPIRLGSRISRIWGALQRAPHWLADYLLVLA